MEKIENLKERSKEMEKYGFVSAEIYNEKLEKTLLVSMRKSGRGLVMIFDNGDDEIASLQYAINSRGVYVSKFVTSEEYQQNGLGRLVFELAMAHGDALGRTEIYGPINPTDPIRGVSDEQNDTFELEKEKLKEIYQCLGCKIDGDNFSQSWKEGERLSDSREVIKFLVQQATDVNEKK